MTSCPTPSPQDELLHAGSLDAYTRLMHQGVDHLSDTIRGLTGAATGVSPELAAKPVADIDLDRPLGDPGAALEEMSRVWLDDAVWFHDPSYAAHLNCPVVLPALLAEVFVSAVNSSLDTFDQSVGGTFVERHLVAWTAARIGFGPAADGVFTSGGTQSNLQALHLARDRALAGPAAGDPGRLRIVTSVDGHFSVQKSARLLGLGDDAVLGVPVDGRRRMRLDALEETLAGLADQGLVPMAVVATAGTTDFGAVDPLPGVAALCARYAAWLHVDAAYGGGLLVAPRRRRLLAGIEHADSVTVDYHKTWFQPVSSSAVIVRERHHLRHVTWHADYLNPRDERDGQPHQPNQVDKSLQTTRRFDALKLWLTLRVLGPDTIGSYVDAVADLAEEVADLLREEPRLELAAAPELSTLVLRYRPVGCTEDEADRLVPRIRAALYDRGLGMVAATRVEGRAWLKLTLLNPMATSQDVMTLLDHVVDLGDELAADRAGVA